MDKAGVLNQQTVEEVTQINESDLSKVTGHPEIAVITVKTTGDEAIEDYAQEQAQKYHIGRKGWNNGVLFVIATKDRKVRMETGYGVEDVLPDDYINTLISGKTKEELHQNDWNAGVLSIVKQTSQRLQQKSDTLLSSSQQKEKFEDPFSVALWVGVIGVITVMVLIILKSSKEKAKVLANVNDILDKYGLVVAMNTTDDTIFLLSNDKKDEKYDEDNERETEDKNDIVFDLYDEKSELLSPKILARNLILANKISEDVKKIVNNGTFNLRLSNAEAREILNKDKSEE
ncbi:TPM domain-containing protein [Lactobacillus taiwanensis]|uniref:TPM domain-containing protein n=1 Tax=Lactobacillus taiwanensis TaxID=508451 RepID=UPI0015C64066|nr:TPM domain-containing protein [Lactobacillus taiwanensis]